jgi:hypothetical protein
MASMEHITHRFWAASMAPGSDSHFFSGSQMAVDTPKKDSSAIVK